MSEYIYILSNPSFSDLYKIGYTANSVEERMSQLYSTGVPSKFVLEFCIEVKDGFLVEKHFHRTLKEYRYGKEFFKLPLPKLIQICKEELLKGDINFISYYGKANKHFLTDDEIKLIKENNEIKKNEKIKKQEEKDKENTREREEKVKEKIREREESIKEKIKEREDRIKEINLKRRLTNDFMCYLENLISVTYEKSPYLNTNSIIKKIFNNDLYEDGKKIISKLSDVEKSKIRKLFVVMVELQNKNILPEIIYKAFIKYGEKIEIIFNKKTYKINLKSTRITYKYSQQLRGIFNGIGIDNLQMFENINYLEVWTNVENKVILDCPNCNQRVRVPKNKKIEITCPSCCISWIQRT